MSIGLPIALAVVLSAAHVPVDDLHTFERVQPSARFWTEAANAADLNRDGVRSGEDLFTHDHETRRP